MILLILSCALILVLVSVVTSGNVGESRASAASDSTPTKLSTPMTLSDLPAPQAISPANGETFGLALIEAEPIVFEWETVENAAGYELMLVTPDQAEPLYISLNVASLQLWLNSASGIPGETDGEYSWAVRTLEYAGDISGQFSEIWTFRIDTLYEGQPTLIAPLDGEIIDQSTVVLEWEVPSDISGVQHSLIQVYNSSVIALENLLHQETVPAPVMGLTLTSLETGTYFWRCQAFDSLGNPSEWSAVWEFSTEMTEPEIPPAPTTTLEMGLHYVDSGGIMYVTSMTEFSFSPASDAAEDIITLYSLDDGPWYEFLEPFYLSGPDGVRNVSFFSKDEFGNTEELKKIQVVLTSLSLDATVSKFPFSRNKYMFNIVLENTWPIEICNLNIDLGIPEEFEIRQILVWLKESGIGRRPIFLFIHHNRMFRGPKTHSFMEELQITFEDNRLSIPWLAAGGKLRVFIKLEFTGKRGFNRPCHSDPPSEFAFGVNAAAAAKSPLVSDEGLVSAAHSTATLVVFAWYEYDQYRFHDLQRHYSSLNWPKPICIDIWHHSSHSTTFWRTKQ